MKSVWLSAASGLPLMLGLLLPDPVLAWAWAGIVAPALGAFGSAPWGLGAQGRPSQTGERAILLGRQLLGLLLVLVVVVLCFPSLPRNAGAAGALGGLLLLGLGLGSLCGGARGTVVTGLLVLGALLALLPSAGGIAGHAPLDPALTARLLALSPASLVVEAGGVDWLRHKAVYDPAGADFLGPELYRPWGVLAGGLPGVLGFAAAASWLALRRAPAAHSE